MTALRLSQDIQNKLMCPFSAAKLHINGENLLTDGGKIHYRIIEGVPVVISEADCVCDVGTTMATGNGPNRPGEFLLKLMPSISSNIKAKDNFRKIINLLPLKAKILVIGGATIGAGMDCIYSNRNFDIVGLDVYLGPFTTIIADAHDIPFENETFDCVIVQAVLGNLVDPVRCINEVYRTIKHEGIVYAETPFMQRNCAGKFDFYRFTHLGVLRLFRQFEEINSGPCCGPGMALAWAWDGFLRSFVTKRGSRFVMRFFAHWTAFFFNYFDHYLIDMPGSYDAASGIFFLGKKNVTVLSDKDLIKRYYGLSGI